jgi:hypothetical protein
MFFKMAKNIKKFDLSITNNTTDSELIIEIPLTTTILPQYEELKLSSARAVSLWLDYV